MLFSNIFQKAPFASCASRFQNIAVLTIIKKCIPEFFTKMHDTLFIKKRNRNLNC